LLTNRCGRTMRVWARRIRSELRLFDGRGPRYSTATRLQLVGSLPLDAPPTAICLYTVLRCLARVRMMSPMDNKDLQACCQLTATCARPSDARIATASSLFIGVLSCCAERLQISRTLAELYWIRRRSPHDRAVTNSSAVRDQRQAL